MISFETLIYQICLMLAELFQKLWQVWEKMARNNRQTNDIALHGLCLISTGTAIKLLLVYIYKDL